MARPAAVRAQEPCGPHAPGIYIAVNDRPLYPLGQARRIPPGNLVTLQGYPQPAQLPRVTLRRADQDAASLAEIPVSRLPGGCGWRAPLPTLPPNARAELTVTQYSALDAAQRAHVVRAFEDLLRTLAIGLERREIRTGIPAVYSQSAREYLAAHAPVDTALAGLVLLDQPLAPGNALSDQLVALLANGEDLSWADAIAFYDRHLGQLGRYLRQDSLVRRLPPAQQSLVSALLARLGGPAFFNADLPTLARRRAIEADLFRPAVAALPLDAATAGALRALVALKPPADTFSLASVDSLAVPLERRFPQLFDQVYRALAESYTVSVVPGPLLTTDLLRYGTLDFVSGRLFQAYPGAQRGFVTFSFFPAGPQPRTPADDTELVGSGRFALAAGYSVVGGGDDEPNYYLAGIVGRLNRIVSGTFGLLAPDRGGRFRCCFLGLAGDLTGIPFLDNLFTQSPTGFRP